MDWFDVLLLVVIGIGVLAIIFGLVDMVGIELSVGDALVIGHDYTPAHKRLHYDVLLKIWRHKPVPASWKLLLQVHGEQSWIEVTEGTYQRNRGEVLKVWFGRGRLSGSVYVSGFYKG